MKITPLEIRQKSFNKNFRGLDKDEVIAFLQSLSIEWEKLLTENQDVKKKLEDSEKEVQKLREVENSLFKTLKTAEDTSVNMVEQSKQAADLHLKEAKMQVESMLNEANNKARNIIEEAEDIASNTFQNLVEELKDIEENSKSIEKMREDFIGDIKSSAKDILEKMSKLESRMQSSESFTHKIKEAKKEFKGKKAVREILDKKDVQPQIITENKEALEGKKNIKSDTSPSEEGSFFDEIK